jgi:hypothetical protein
MRLLDSALSRGLLGDGDYMLRADALQQATSIEQMNAIVQQLPVLENLAKSRPATSGGSRRRRTDRQVEVPLISQEPEMNLASEISRAPEMTPAPQTSKAPEISKPSGPVTGSDDLKALDPVDVAMLLKSRQVRKPSSNRRMKALAVVGILFLVLIVIGVLLAEHDRSVNGSNGLLQPHYLIVARTLIA